MNMEKPKAYRNKYLLPPNVIVLCVISYPRQPFPPCSPFLPDKNISFWFPSAPRKISTCSTVRPWRMVSPCSQPAWLQSTAPLHMLHAAAPPRSPVPPLFQGTNTSSGCFQSGGKNS